MDIAGCVVGGAMIGFGLIILDDSLRRFFAWLFLIHGVVILFWMVGKMIMEAT